MTHHRPRATSLAPAGRRRVQQLVVVVAGAARAARHCGWDRCWPVAGGGMSNSMTMDAHASATRARLG